MALSGIARASSSSLNGSRLDCSVNKANGSSDIGVWNLREQMEAIMAPLKSSLSGSFSTEKWREQIEAIMAPLRQLESEMLVTQSQTVFASMWYNQMRALFATFPRAVKWRKIHRGDHILQYVNRSQKKLGFGGTHTSKMAR